MKNFFDTVRERFGPLRQAQVDGLTLLLNASRALPLRHRAYVLATAWHETGPMDDPRHMTSRREIWGPTKAQKAYEGRADLGNTVNGDGKRFMGRSYPQLTGRRNYAKASEVMNRDLVGRPDDVLIPEIGAAIMIDGMTKGWFTGVKLSDCATYQGMRRVVNDKDKAELIAGYAYTFEAALEAAADEPEAPAPAPAPAPVPAPGKVDTEIPHLPPLADDDTNGLAAARGLRVGLAVLGAAAAVLVAVLVYHFMKGN